MSFLLQIVLIVAVLALIVYGSFWCAYMFKHMVVSPDEKPNPYKAFKENLNKLLKRFGWKIKDDPKRDNSNRSKTIFATLGLLVLILACVLGS